MPRPKPDKQELLQKIAEFVLTNGLNSASLRPMAAAAEISDRMLVYHFGSKEELIAEILQLLASRLSEILDEAIPPRRYRNEGKLLQDAVSVLRSEVGQSYVSVWLDVVSAAQLGQAPQRESGESILDLFLRWIGKRHPHGEAGAFLLLALIEGVVVMDAVGQSESADRAIQSYVGRRNA